MKQSLENTFVWSLIAAIALTLMLGIGVGGLLEDAGLGETFVNLLPWVPVVLMGIVGALILMDAISSGRLTGRNRLMHHVIGWTILAILCFVLKYAGDPILEFLEWEIPFEGAETAPEGFLAKTWLVIKGAGPGILNYISEFLVAFVGIFVAFGEAMGRFAGVIAAIIAFTIAAIGWATSGNERPGKIERLFVGNIVSKIAAVPMVLTTLGIFVGATLWTVAYSFTKSRLLPKFELDKLSLDQYERLWGEPRWIQSIINLGLYGVASLIFTMVLGFVLAAMLDRKIRFENTFRTIFLYPFALSFIVTGLVWQWILNPEFGLQSIIRGWGWETFTFDPLNNQDIVIFGLLIAGLWQGTGLVMCIMLAGLRGIDEEIWKATRVDGIPMWKTYIRVVIPMMKPVFITALVLISSGIVRLYDLVVAQTSGGPGISSEVPAKYVYDKMFLGQNLGQGFAASTMMLLSVVIILIPWAYLQFSGKKND